MLISECKLHFISHLYKTELNSIIFFIIVSKFILRFVLSSVIRLSHYQNHLVTLHSLSHGFEEVVQSRVNPLELNSIKKFIIVSKFSSRFVVSFVIRFKSYQNHLVTLYISSHGFEEVVQSRTNADYFEDQLKF
jgi:hypothetical protein